MHVIADFITCHNITIASLLRCKLCWACDGKMLWVDMLEWVVGGWKNLLFIKRSKQEKPAFEVNNNSPNSVEIEKANQQIGQWKNS